MTKSQMTCAEIADTLAPLAQAIRKAQAEELGPLAYQLNKLACRLRGAFGPPKRVMRLGPTPLIRKSSA